MEMFSDMLGPTSMFLTGTWQAKDYKKKCCPIKSISGHLFETDRISPYSNRGPAIQRLPVPASGLYSGSARVLFMAAAAPPAANVAQVAVIYNKHPAKAGFYNILGMLLCVLTMPLIDYIYGLVFLG